jgi:hypothetical protein
MSKFRSLFIAVLVGASVLVGAQAAEAARKIASISTGGEYAEFGQRTSGSYYLMVCDRARGYAAIGYVSYYYGGRQNIVAELRGSGNCTSRTVQASRGRTVYVMACRYYGVWPPLSPTPGDRCGISRGVV